MILTWILAGLFVLFGLPLMLTDDPAWRQIWGGLSTLALGGFAVSMVWTALPTGQIRLQYSVIRHAQQPRLFWASVLLVAAAGGGVLISSGWLLLFKST